MISTERPDNHARQTERRWSSTAGATLVAGHLIRQCKQHKVPYFLKQLGSVVHRRGERVVFDDNHAGDWTEWQRGLKDRSSGHEVRKIDKGRYPANVILDEEAADALDRQSGKSKSHRSRTSKAGSNVGNGKTLNPFKSRVDTVEGYDDEGGPSRFFYCAKASGNERRDNDHPTVKPLALCEYLARLILQPTRETPRRLLLPYSGSGSEMIAALSAGWDHVTGIEWHEPYVATSRRRLSRTNDGLARPA